MNHDLPSPNEIIEDLADKAALQIDRQAPVAFDAALKEMTRYHRFLLNLNASRTPENVAFNYASIAGDRWRPPHDEWIGQYRRLFELAANRIGDDPEFIAKLSYVPLTLMPKRGDPELSEEVILSIIGLGPILIHRLEAWVTKRTVVETIAGTASTARIGLVGSEAKAYTNLLPDIIGAWESLLQAAPSLYGWKADQKANPSLRWNALRASWPFLWEHLIDTAYMLSVSVWNEDEAAASVFRDALVRWPQTLSYEFDGNATLSHRRLLFPEILKLEWTEAITRIEPILLEYMPPPTADELFISAVYEAHNDVLLLTSAVMLLWSMREKQVSDIGARTANGILRRQLEDKDAVRGNIGQPKSFSSLAMDIIRLEFSGERYRKDTYGARLDGLVQRLDNMTERRVVPGRIFTPSTLHGREELHSSLLAMLMAVVPEDDHKPIVARILELANNERILPEGDRSLRDILDMFRKFSKSLDQMTPELKRGVEHLNSGIDFSSTSQNISNIFTTTIDAIETVRRERLRQKPIDVDRIGSLRLAVERSLLTSARGVAFFQGFSTETTIKIEIDKPIKFSLNGLSKAQFVDPPMEQESFNFVEFYTNHVNDFAHQNVWFHFKKKMREKITIASRIVDQTFWNAVRKLALEVGAQPLLIVSMHAEEQILRRFIYQNSGVDWKPKVEKKTGAEINNGYIATMEGVDVYSADFDSGTAWLFSAYILQSIQYLVSADGKIVKLSFDLEAELKGSLVAEFSVKATWEDWPIYEISCKNPKN